MYLCLLGNYEHNPPPKFVKMQVWGPPDSHRRTQFLATMLSIAKGNIS